MSLIRRTALLICLGFLVFSINGGALAATDYSIDTTQSIETPPRTFSVSGESWTVTSLGYVNAGETLSFEVQTPGDTLATINLYNSQKQIADSKRAPSDGTYTFETDSLSPGTYVLALSVDGTIQTIQPVVVSGYTFNVQAPNTVTAGENIEVSTKITEGSGTPNSVDVIVLNESWQKDITATKVGENAYSAIISTDLASGSYQLYIGARGTETVSGEKELVGISAAQTLEVEPKATPTTTTTTTSSGGGTAPGGSSPPMTTTTQATPTTTTVTTTTIANPTTSTPTTTVPTTSIITTPATPNDTPSTTQSTNTPTATTSGANVIKPNMENTTSTTTPGFTGITALIALGALLLRD